MRRSKGRLGRNNEGAVSACAMGGRAVYTGEQVYTPSGLANETTHFCDQTCQAVFFVFMVSTPFDTAALLQMLSFSLQTN